MEDRLYSRLKRATPGFHWQRHEDKLTPGIPDTSYACGGVSGWVELKTYDNWPQDPDEPLSWSDLKPEQVNWLIARGRQCDRCYILLEVGKNPKTSEWLLIPWQVLRKVTVMNPPELRANSVARGIGPLKPIARFLR